jgi:hypothetical protein
VSDVNCKIPQAPDAEPAIPTWEEVFEKPHSPPSPLPPAWEGDSIAVEFVDRECARLIANCLFDPPITDQEIRAFARRFKISEPEAEIEIRRTRNA